MDLGAATTGVVVEAVRPGERPYPPSWINRFIWWIDRLPGSSWAWYLGAAIVSALISNVQASAAGLQPAGTITVQMTYYGALLVALLASIAYLDRAARRSAIAFQPALALPDEAFAAFVHRLTIIPARPVLVMSVAAPLLTALYLVGDPEGTGTAGLEPWALALRWLSESIVGILFLALAYHTLRQLREVDRAHRAAPEVNVFVPRPLYAFAGLTTRTAIVLLLLLGSSIPADPQNWERANPLITVPWFVLITGVALATFVAPLWGMHARIAAEKGTLQDACGRRITDARAAFHDAVDGADAARVDSQNKILAALISEREWLAKLPTWPWQPGQIGAVVSAIVLPVVLFVVTRLLGSALGG